jgi:hypothetical protein
MLALEIFEDAVQRCCVLDLRGGNGGMSVGPVYDPCTTNSAHSSERSDDYVT